jgi:polyhydroxybutyrate depolymerase
MDPAIRATRERCSKGSNTPPQKEDAIVHAAVRVRTGSRLSIGLLALSVALMQVAEASGGEVATCLTEHTIRIDAESPVRSYIVVRPSSYERGAPAVVVLHGGSQSMRKILQPTQAPSRWIALAEEHGFLLLVPNGYNTDEMSGAGEEQTWNDLRPSSGNGVSEENDVAFIEAMLDREGGRHRFDPGTVFVTGSSNGGMMTYRLLIERPTRFAAGAAFIANLPQGVIPDPTSPTPVMIMNGDADSQMPWEGGIVGINGAPVRSAAETFGYWNRVNGSADAPSVSGLLPDRAPNDGTRILETIFPDPTTGKPSVAVYRVINGGHAMPMLETDPQFPLPDSIGPRSHDARGVDVAWSFFSRYVTEAVNRDRGTRSPPSNLADFDSNGRIDASDLSRMLGAWGPDACDAADLTADGRVDATDLSILLGLWGS